ncbi:MAG TPA: metal ABC transporter permease [Thermoanaerobaculia bacterium]|nr:metal ABC transporter permease [Thermoanaerobaculia bacterium]
MLLQVLEFLYPALLATVVLSAIHSWLGIQLLERGAVFPALALVQLAALGTAVATRFGFSPYIGAFVLSISGAFLFTWNRRDTLVAMIYAVSAAATLLFLGGDPLTGDLLSVRVRTIALIAVVYIAVAAALYFLRRESLLFFAVAIVLTSSVRIAGVLLAFTYLVAPPIVSRRFAIAWPVSALLSAAGIFLAFKFDQPTALTVVCTFGVALVVVLSAQSLVRRRKPPKHYATKL